MRVRALVQKNKGATTISNFPTITELPLIISSRTGARVCEQWVWSIRLAAIADAIEPRIYLYVYPIPVCTLTMMPFSVQRQYSLMKRHYRNESTQIHRRCSTIWRLWHVQFARWVIQCTAYTQRNFNLFKFMLDNNEQKINEFDVRKKTHHKRECEVRATRTLYVGVKHNKYMESV